MSAGARLSAVGISSSTAAKSRSRLLVARTLAHLREQEVATSLVELAALSADALLGRRTDNRVSHAIGVTTSATILVIGTPIYRASYSGQLKAFFDLLPRDTLVGRVAGLVATGYGEGHQLAIDHGLRPLVASLGGLSAARSVYVTDAQVPDPARVPDELDERLSDLACELADLAGVLALAPVSSAVARSIGSALASGGKT